MNARQRALGTIGFLLLGLIALGLPAQLAAPRAQAQPPTPIKVMPLGDSITAGTDQTYAFPMASYRCELYKSLAAAGYSVDFVGSVHGQWGNGYPEIDPPTYCTMIDWDQEGHSGWAIYHILDGAGSWPGTLATWATQYTPDVVLIHLGTNNFVYGPPNYPAPDVEAAISQMARVIDTLRAANPRVRIVLAQILPCMADKQNLIPQFNARLVTLADQKNAPFSPIVVVDMYSGFNFADHFLADGVHPNQNGENKMAVRWKAGFDRVMRTNNWIFVPLVTQ